MEDQETLVLETPGQDLTDEETISRLFHFPFPRAYKIQLDLMQAIFRAIEDGKVGVFESPTGTGKSLSLICAAFTWLRSNAERASQGALGAAASGTDAEPDWVLAHETQRRQQELMRREEQLNERIAKARQRMAKDRARMKRSEASRKRIAKNESDSDSDDAFLVHESFDGRSHAPRTEDDSAFLSPEVRALMAQMEARASGANVRKPYYARARSAAKDGDEEDDEEPETQPKIFYASRTHSQLSQFVAELRKTEFGLNETKASEDNDDTIVQVRSISLGSRKQMCINDKVQSLGQKAGPEAMNERCQELMKNTTGKNGSRCEYLPSNDETGYAAMLDYRDRAFAEVQDIEELVDLGRDMHNCPYFGARTSARQAQLVTLPYNLLLNQNARFSLNADLAGSVVIIDEAHNLIDTILSVHSVSITSLMIEQASKQIAEYLRRFSSKLRGQNEVNLRRLATILEGLKSFVKSFQAGKSTRAGAVSEKVHSVSDVLARMGGTLDQINLAELEYWLKESQIARKVAGYAEKREKKEAALTDKVVEKGVLSQSAVSAMHSVETFILSMANKRGDGRILSTLRNDHDAPLVTLKYQLLNPSEAFTDIVRQARAVILAGGTMAPLSDFRTQLVPTLPMDRFTTFSCGHIIPRENLLGAIVHGGPRGTPFEFRFESRNDAKLLDDLANCLTNYTNIVPHGLVVFLPSYAFLDTVLARWKETGALKRLETKKPLFYEPKSAAEVDAVLKEYTRAIDSCASARGAMLFAVVGAKLSEGINFSDRLARAVVMVGMPFANAQEPELAERMSYVRKLAANAALQSERQNNGMGQQTQVDAGHELYVNLCMKAVNQSIGRAIRHQGDFAALVLLDRRYARSDIRAKLPAWIKDATQSFPTFGPSMAALGQFYRAKKGVVGT